MAAGGWGGVGAWGAGNKSGGAWAQEDVEGAPASATQQQPQQQGQSYIGGYAPPAAQQPSQPSGFNAGAFSSRFGGGSAPSGPQDLASREAAVKKKEAELARKEAELAKLEADIKAAGGSIRRKNWPRCYPLLHHDINEDIPEKSRRPVREAYLAWWGLVVCLSWQVFCASVMLGFKQADQRVASWFLSLIYWLCGVPLAFILWYRKVYFGAMSDSTYKWLSFFLWFAVHFGFCVWAAIAVPFSAEQWSFSGFVTAAKAIDVASFPGVIYFIGASLWSCEAAFSLWVIRDVWWFFRNKGGVEKAQQEAAMAAVRQGVKSQTTTSRV